MNAHEAGEIIDSKVRALMAASGIKTYTEALHAVLDDPDNAALARDYAAVTSERVRSFDAIKHMVLEYTP